MEVGLSVMYFGLSSFVLFFSSCIVGVIKLLHHDANLVCGKVGISEGLHRIKLKSSTVALGKRPGFRL